MESDEGEAKVAQLANWRDSMLFSESEQVALDYAERVTITGQQVDEPLFARLKAQDVHHRAEAVARHYSEKQIVELTAAIALENFRSKFNPALGIEAQGLCMIPPR